MVRDEATLALLHADLQRALARLDELGCVLGAVHLAAAIQALEAEMRMPAPEVVRADARQYAIALRREVGDRAEAIVRQQIKLAQGDVLRSWSEILAHLQSLD